MGARKGQAGTHHRRLLTPLQRFVSYCRFEPSTGCVLWTGAKTMGRGHHTPYPAFWFEGRRWFGHRWAAQYIHGIDIEGYHVDHCCPHIPIPNTLCVEHVQALTLRDNVLQQHERRRTFIRMQVGLLNYEDVYGAPPAGELEDDSIPFHIEPDWLRQAKGPDPDGCPF